KKVWSAAPKLLSPANGASINFPQDPLLLSWTPMLGAVRYDVAIARDPGMTSLVSGAQTVTTAASYVPPTTLAAGVTYYWTVTPVDAEGHAGATSVVRSFTWNWQTSTTANPTDLVSAPEFYDPLLSWAPVPGAAKYELDVNFSQDFNSSSSVYSATTDATGFSPLKPFPNNTYYWRVRPINAQGDAGIWTQGTGFTQFFDTEPPLVGSTVTGLHMRDELSDTGPKPPGWSTAVPILVWSPVA